MKASPGRGKLSPQVTDEGAGQQYFTLNTPHPALRATFSPFCRCATFSPGAGEICPQGVKALALGQAAKVDFRAASGYTDHARLPLFRMSRRTLLGRAGVPFCLHEKAPAAGHFQPWQRVPSFI